jgi:hypothetical protein
MGFQLWDRNTGNLIAEFGDQKAALAFIRDQIEGLDSRAAELEVERMALLYVQPDGRTVRKVAEGHGVLDLIAVPAGTVGH